MPEGDLPNSIAVKIWSDLGTMMIVMMIMMMMTMMVMMIMMIVMTMFS